MYVCKMEQGRVCLGHCLISCIVAAPLLAAAIHGGAPLDRRSIVHKAMEVDHHKQMGGVHDTNEHFDHMRLCTITRHGIAPARSANATSKAKINQDRGCVCWPFNGSHNQALLCIFDGHGMQGEKLSEWCVQEIPPSGRMLFNPSTYRPQIS